MIDCKFEISFPPMWFAMKNLIAQQQSQGKAKVTTIGKMTFKQWILEKVSVVADEAIKISRRIIQESMPGGSGRTLHAARIVSKTIDAKGVTIGLFDAREMKALSRDGKVPYWKYQEGGTGQGKRYYKMTPKQRRAIAIWYAMGNIPNSNYRFQPSTQPGYARYIKGKHFVDTAKKYLREKAIKIDYCESYIKYLAAGYVKKFVIPANWNKGYSAVMGELQSLYKLNQNI